MRKIKTFESFMDSQLEEIMQEVDDMLVELRDKDFSARVQSMQHRGVSCERSTGRPIISTSRVYNPMNFEVEGIRTDCMMAFKTREED